MIDFSEIGDFMIIFLSTIALADPQDIPEDSEDSENSENSDDSEEADYPPKPLTEEDIDLNFLFNDPENSSYSPEEADFSWFRGDINYSFDLRFWESEGTSKTLFSGTFSGDPQHLWEIRDDFGPSLGIRFKLSGSESRTMLIQDHLIGLTGGFQMGAVRINTAGSYMFNHLFQQEELTKDNNTKEISYRYQEQLPLHGILWENTLTLTFDPKFVFQGYYSIPVGLGGERDVGDMFVDSWQVGADFVFKTFLFGYQYNIYPQNQEHIAIFGTSLGR